MTSIYRVRENALADDDVKTQLSTVGSQTTPGPLLVPGNAAFLKSVKVVGVSSNEAADQYAFLFRLEGPGIKKGSFVVAGGAGGGSVATGGHVLVPATKIPVGLPVTPNQEILVFAEALGDDMGTYQAALEFEFSTEVGPAGEIKGEITVEGDITAVDTLTRLTNQGSVSSPSRLTPPDATKLKRIVCSVASDGAADGEVTYHLRISGDAVRGGEQILLIGGESYIDVQSGSDSQHVAMAPIILDDLDIDIAPNETIDFSVEMAGVDIGSATAVVTGMFV